MGEAEKDLTSRYYAAEVTSGLLGGILLVARYFGITPDQPLPLLNVTLDTSLAYVRIVAILLIATMLYLFVEWTQSSRAARETLGSSIRLLAAICWTVVTLWLSYPILSHGTRFAGISPVWYLGFVSIGLLLGTFVDVVASSCLMIRSPEESKRLRLPRIPAATRAQFVMYTPVIILLLIAYFVLHRFTPSQIGVLATLLAMISVLLVILVELASLCPRRDENGQSISYAKKIARLKEIYDAHDYAYFLIDQGGRLVKELGLDPAGSPHQMQEAMRSHFSQPTGGDPIHFHFRIEEEIQLRFYPKDGKPENPDPKNRGIKLTNRGNKKFFRVTVSPDDPSLEPQRMEIPVSYLETYAEEYCSALTDKKDLTVEKLLSHAINQSVNKMMMDEPELLLCRAAEAGQTKAVRELIQKKDVDINERGEFGWTPLLFASAQGNPEIASLLLEAGANPDIGNVRGITPLMYGARYGNSDVCEVLLDYQAALDLRDVHGMTALIVATCHGHYSVVDLLIKAGADTTVKTHEGKTALDLAYARKHGKIAKILKQANKSIQAIR